MSWALLGGSLAAVLGLAALARALGLGGATLGNEAEAREIAEGLLPGFDATDARIASEGATALLRGRDGSVAVLRRHGAHFVARRLTPPIQAERQGRAIVVDSGERAFGPVTIALESEAAARELTSMLMERPLG